jgi:hypothetical protein
MAAGSAELAGWLLAGLGADGDWHGQGEQREEEKKEVAGVDGQGRMARGRGGEMAAGSAELAGWQGRMDGWLAGCRWRGEDGWLAGWLAGLCRWRLAGAMKVMTVGLRFQSFFREEVRDFTVHC